MVNLLSNFLIPRYGKSVSELRKLPQISLQQQARNYRIISHLLLQKEGAFENLTPL